VDYETNCGGRMNSSTKKYAQRELSVSETDEKGVYCNSIVTVTSNLVKKKCVRVCVVFVSVCVSMCVYVW